MFTRKDAALFRGKHIGFIVLFFAVFIAVTGSFKAMMIGQISDSFIGHMQIHCKGDSRFYYETFYFRGYSTVSYPLDRKKKTKELDLYVRL